MIRHIFFDIDDTLFSSTEFALLARKNALNAMIRMGVQKTTDELERELNKIIKKRGANYERHFDELCKNLNIKEDAKFVAAAVAAYHDTKTAMQPFPTAPITLLQLREMGYHLHVATNGNSVKQWDKLIRLGLALYFDRVFVSEEIGRTKDPKFFEIIIKKLHAKPQDCLMIGDREDADIVPAKKLGMITVRIKSGKYIGKLTVADYEITDLCELLNVVKH